MSDGTQVKRFPKGSTVRVSDPTDFGYGKRYVILGGSVRYKGAKELKVRSLENGHETTKQPHKLTLELNLSMEQMKEMDEKVAIRAAEAAAQHEAFEAMRQRRAEEELAAELAADIHWAATIPAQLNARGYDGGKGARIELGIESEKDENDRSQQYLVEVYLDRDKWGKVKGTITRGVNWSAIGTVSPELARAYARTILAAADLAEKAVPEAYKPADEA